MSFCFRYLSQNRYTLYCLHCMNIAYCCEELSKQPNHCFSCVSLPTMHPGGFRAKGVRLCRKGLFSCAVTRSPYLYSTPVFVSVLGHPLSLNTK